MMPDKYRDIIEKIVVGGGLATLGVTITALLDKNKLVDKIRNAFAGIIAGVLASFILRDTNIRYETPKEIFLVAIASFVGAFWSIFQDAAIIVFNVIKKYVSKKVKADADVQDDHSK